MKLYVVRHGETLENANDCLVGRINSSLTIEGINQAKVVKEKFKDINIDLIVSSPLDRCKQTAEVISDNIIPIIYSDKLLGRDHGEFTGKPKSSINFDEYWNYNKNIQYEKAESIKDLYDRVDNLIKELKEEYKDKNIIIVTHSGIMRILYYYFKGIPEDGILGEVTIRNCEVYEYDL
ncbi:MAG: histidine phosphatase family protein [Firmicutes bacterium]|nr:histidine phosphatase family protein [Bacillota bacterium]